MLNSFDPTRVLNPSRQDKVMDANTYTQRQKDGWAYTRTGTTLPILSTEKDVA